MKKHVYEVDENGFFKEIYLADVDDKGIILDEDKQGFITVDYPSGLRKKQWTGTEWIEGATQEEIDKLTKFEPSSPTQEERIGMLENMILLMMEG